MGGAHPYSYFDGITIDCETGKEIAAAELLGKDSDEILQQVSDEMGLDTVASWDEVDSYLTDSTIVFFTGCRTIGKMQYGNGDKKDPRDITMDRKNVYF